MDELNNKTFDLFGILKSWICWRSKYANVSRDFWMPDHSCRVCYECDTQFTLFNRRHHCRLCGRIFCAKCTTNSVPASSVYSSDEWDEWDRVRVCNYCFMQWEQGLVRVANGRHDDACHTPSADGASSSKSCVSAFNSTITINSMSFSFFEHISENCSLSPGQSSVIYPSVHIQGMEESGMTNISMPCSEVSFVNQFDMGTNRSDEDHNDVYGIYPLDTKPKSCSDANDYYGPMEFDGFENAYDLHNFVPHMENVDTINLTTSTFEGLYDVQDADKHQQVGKKEDHDIGDECDPTSSLCAVENVNLEPVDFENNGLLWLPPEPENEEDDREVGLFDVDGDDDGDAVGEWGNFRTSGSFGSGGHISKDRSAELPKNAMKNVVEGHFRVLISQLLLVENIPISDDDLKESWLEIITSLSWEAATLLKPDTSRGGGMDPGGYVKVKCIASGLRSESGVVKGVVCKKNVAHRRMAARIEKPRIMILGGDLEYQRVSNLLSSFDTLLQQEMDHLKMAVAKIDAHRPNVLLVEKSVSRYAQDYILAKDISLVLNIKRPLLERIARCTGAQIVPSIDHLSIQKMGYCDLFHVDRCFENHGSSGQAGRKLTKNLMYFDGCPKPHGCTILLRGANGDELKKVKHVVQYGIFAAYHLSLETSFLADEGASLLDNMLNEPITLPNKSVDRSISLVSGFSSPTSEKQQKFGEPQLSNAISKILPTGSSCVQPDLEKSSSLTGDLVEHVGPTLSSGVISCFANETLSSDLVSPVREVDKTRVDDFLTNHEEPPLINQRVVDETRSQQVTKHEPISEVAHDANAGGLGPCEQDANTNQDGPESLKDEFPSTSSDNQSILVSLSSQCVWKGTVCERAHLFRIKYYGSFDKPLGRFLHDHLFDQNYRCHSCNLSSEAHVQCYTHRQGTLTISVRKLDELFLSGEREGKIWMWHRCLRCPRMSGFPPATRRVLMSDAAWGLSFGKFLELSFSNHAAASRVAGCGHSLHRDCLRFYGCGKMVACFRYASINVFSVYLPPAKIEFNYESQDWIRKEAKEVVNQAEFLFSEVHNAIGKIADGKCDGAALDSDLITSKSRNRIGALEGVLQIEKKEFKEMHWKTVNREAKSGCPTLDILDINRLRRQLLLQSYMWDHRLVYAAGLSDDSFNNDNVGSVLVSVDENLANTAMLHPDLVKRSGHGVEEETKNVLDSSEMVNPSSKTSPGLSPSREDQCGLLESGSTVRRAMSDSHSLSLSDTLDVAWAGGSRSFLGKDDGFLLGSNCADSSLAAVAEKLAKHNRFEERSGAKILSSPSPALSANPKGPENAEDIRSWFGIPFLNFYRSINRNFLQNAQKLDTFGGYSPMYVSSFRELELQGGAKWLLPIGYNETVIPVYDDEPTSIISYALVSQDYHNQLSDEGEKSKETVDHSLSTSLQQSASLLSLNESISESHRSPAIEESISSTSGSRNSVMTDQILHFRSLHIRVSFSDNGPLDEVKYTVTCYYAKRFDSLRKICCPSEIDFVRSLSRCKKWGAQGGKSNVFFAKTLDDRFIIKQVTKTELEAFIKFAPEYFKYVMESIGTKSPTCLAKILGIFQVTTKHLKGGKETKMDVLVMENLLFRRSVTRLYDLKGSSRSRYNPDSSGSNKVLLDQNLIEAMSTSPIFVGNKAKRLLERAVWNDTSFLASIDVMDYSLLVGVDEESHELVLGIIDFMRQYTWDKHLETWVKASGILGGPKNVSPTVISPMQYKKRFRKAMTTYFLMVPDQWSPPSVMPSQYQTNLSEENTHGGS